MAGSKVNTYGVGDVDLTNIMTVIDSQRQGYYKVSLTNYDNDSKPEIAAGSKIEINGSLFKFDSDESIGGSPSDGLVLIKLIPSGSSVTAEFTNDLPLWDDEKGGWYEPSTNNRYLHFSMYLDSGDYLEKNEAQFGATGDIRPWPTDSAPWPWVLCDGSAYDADTDTGYARLYHVIKNTFGGADNTDFCVPDLRGRGVVGKDNMGGSSANRVTDAAADSVGGTGVTKISRITDTRYIIPDQARCIP